MRTRYRIWSRWDRIVCVVGTGWAEVGGWNEKNKVCEGRVPREMVDGGKGVMKRAKVRWILEGWEEIDSTS